MRDLRLLDPQMQSASPSAILCRDKAIVVNLEYVKAIITMDRVLVLNHQDPSVALVRLPWGWRFGFVKLQPATAVWRAPYTT